jgi:hypothetical protein
MMGFLSEKFCGCGEKIRVYQSWTGIKNRYTFKVETNQSLFPIEVEVCPGCGENLKYENLIFEEDFLRKTV